MKKILIIAISILILAAILNNLKDLKVILNPEKGTFEELIFTEKEFDRLSISNRVTKNDRDTEDKVIVKEMLEYIKDIKLIEKLKFNPRNTIPDKNYSIELRNNKTFESVDIYFLDEDYVRIWTNSDYKIYKIDGTKIDINYIEEIFNKLGENQ